MGILIDREDFSDEDYAAFAARLQEELEALEALIERPGFGVGASSLGAELELFLVDARGYPFPGNRAVLAKTFDERVGVEVDKFNLECNARPVALAGSPFAGLSDQLTGALAAVRVAAHAHGARPAVIGILPTLRPSDLQAHALTDLIRYRALSASIRRLKQEPFRIRIDGDEPLAVDWNDVTAEGANTSLQIHLRVDPGRFADLYNAAQLATAPVLAVSGNSPLFLGHRLWHETRVALCKQSTDPRPAALGSRRAPSRIGLGFGWVRRGALELFREGVALHPPLLPIVPAEDPRAVVAAGGVPELAALRLHNGTIYSWNRPVYDPDGGGHLRIEMRALPAGPTIVDMMANAAFLVGLTLGLAPAIEALLPAIPFHEAESNFYRAAQIGLDAELAWPSEEAPSPRHESARALVPTLLPVAARGLRAAGVDSAEVHRLLSVIEGRTRSGQTGAFWQRQTLLRLEATVPRERALELLVTRYLQLSEAGDPVHLWPI